MRNTEVRVIITRSQTLLLGVLLLGVSLFTPFLSHKAHAALPGLNGLVLVSRAPDGGSASDRDLYTMRLDGTNLTRLTNNAFIDDGARFSPDGTKIIFHSNRSGDNDIYVMNTDGSNLVNLTNNVASDTFGAFSPDGTKIAFSSDRAIGGVRYIYTMNTDGSNLVQVSTTGSTDNFAEWSAHSDKIVYTSGGSNASELYTVTPDGTQTVRLTNDSVRQTDAAFSPDGTKIAYVNGLGASGVASEIAVMNTDGTQKTILTSNAVPDLKPNWYADGSKIIYTTDGTAGNRELYTMNSDGTNMQAFTDDAAYDYIFVAIQPLTLPPATIDTSYSLDATSGEPASYNTLANHTDSYEGLDPTSVSITTAATKGITSIDSATGTITYTPNQQTASSLVSSYVSNMFFPKVSAQSANQDTLTYRICSLSNNQLCASHTLTIQLAGSEGQLANTGLNADIVTLVSFILMAGGIVGIKRTLIRR